jgi:hypothetical protein
MASMVRWRRSPSPFLLCSTPKQRAIGGTSLRTKDRARKRISGNVYKTQSSRGSQGCRLRIATVRSTNVNCAVIYQVTGMAVRPSATIASRSVVTKLKRVSRVADKRRPPSGLVSLRSFLANKRPVPTIWPEPIRKQSHLAL